MDTLLGLVFGVPMLLALGGVVFLAVGAFVVIVAAVVVARWLTDPRSADALDARIAAKRARRAAARAAPPTAQGEFAPARPGWSSVTPARRP